MVDYATRDITALSGLDYSPAFGVAVFPPGATNFEVLVSIIGDLLPEADETFLLILTNAIHGNLTRSYATGTILNDDFPPELSVNDAVIVTDGNGNNNAVFTVNASAASGEVITVDYETVNGSASSGAEFIHAADTLSFAPGVVRQLVSVPIFQEAATQPAETFFLALSDPMNATIRRNRAVAAILHPGPIQVASMKAPESAKARIDSSIVESKQPATLAASPLPPPVVERTDASLDKEPVKPSAAFASSSVTVSPGTNILFEINALTNILHVESEVAVTFEISNRGAEPAQGVVLTNWLPSSASFISAQTSLGTFTNEKDWIVFDFGPLSPGAIASGAIHFKFSAAGWATNVAQLGFAGIETNGSNYMKNQPFFAVNDLPVISTVASQFTPENTPTTPIPIRISDTETPGSELILLGSSSNQGLVPDQNLLLGGNGNNRTLTIMPALNQAGSATIILTAIDSDGGEANVKFDLTVGSLEALTIERVDGISAPYFELVEREGNLLKFHFRAEAGLSHRVEFTDSLSSGAWQTLTNIDPIPVSTFQEVSDDTSQSPQRYYRLNISTVGGSSRVSSSTGGRIVLHFNAKAGKPYTVEYRDSLEASAWQILTRINPLQQSTTITVSDVDAGETARFYRVRSP